MDATSSRNEFNPDTMKRNGRFWAVLMNPVAVNKFLHTVISSYIVASLLWRELVHGLF